MRTILLSCILSILLTPNTAQAEDAPTPPLAQSMITGGLGLFETPNARFDPTGQMRVGFGYEEAYKHMSIGAQITPWLHINIRQSTDILDGSNFKGDQFQGLDFKVRLREETEHFPAVAIGANSIVGKKRLQSEYLTLSKKWNNLDTHIGFGWGRLAGRGAISNPFRIASKSFENPRSFNSTSEPESALSDLFTSDEVGIFAGASYQTSHKPLKLFIEASSKDGAPESQATSGSYNEGTALNLGAQYQIGRHLQLTGAWQNTERLAFYLSAPLGLNMLSLPTSYKDTSHLPQPRAIDSQNKDNVTKIWLEVDEEQESVPHSIRRIMSDIEQNDQIDVQDTIHFVTQKHGLKGYELIMVGRDLKEQNRYLATPPELWRNSSYKPSTTHYKTLDYPAWEEKEAKDLLLSHLTLNLKHQYSIQDVNRSGLHRTRATLDYLKHVKRKYFWGISLGANLYDNFDQQTGGIFPGYYPIRSDVAEYNDRIMSIDRLFVGANYNLGSGFYGHAMVGDVEEMYSAAGTEILYRPLGKRFAVKGSLWFADKRDHGSDDTFVTNLSNGNDTFYDNVLTGHIDLYYEAPKDDLTYTFSVGRYLAKDWGMRLGLMKRFDNNVELSMGATLSVTNDLTAVNNALQNNTLNVGSNEMLFDMRLRIPLHHKLGLPVKTYAEFDGSPIARDAGQRLDIPYDIYKETEGLSIRHLTSHWSDIR